jgi:hypothetical protein
MSEAVLNLWTDGTETYVADSAEAAMEMQVICLGENPSDVNRWHVRENKGPITIDMSERDAGDGEMTKTHAEWIAHNGPGFLSLTEH